MFPYRYCFLPLLFVALFGSDSLLAQTYTVYDSFPQLEARIKQASPNTTLVINFWATWCPPCVQELPHFDSLQKQYANQNVEVLLVSLDFKNLVKKRLEPFLQERNLVPEVVLLADQDANTWIPLICESWDGALPATVVLRGKIKKFYLGQFDNYSQLETFILNAVGNVDDPATDSPCNPKSNR